MASDQEQEDQATQASVGSQPNQLRRAQTHADKAANIFKDKTGDDYIKPNDI